MISLVIPLRVVSDNNLSSHQHWRERQQRAKRQSGLVQSWLTNRWSMPRGQFQRLPEKLPPLPIDVLLTRISPRELDDDNLVGSLKAVRDGVARTYGINDRDRNVARFHYAWRRGGVNEYCVQVDIAPRAVGAFGEGILANVRS